MTAKDCINGKAAAGQVDPERAQQAADLFDELEGEYRGRMSGPDAAAQAGQDAAAAMAREIERETANRFRMAKRGAEIARHIEGFRNAKGEAVPGRAALSLLTRDLGDRAGISNVEARKATVLGTAHAISETMLETLRPRAAGLVRSKARTERVVRELFGQKTGDDAAAASAKAWSRAAEYLRLRFNRAGGAIGKREDWGTPQSHDMRAVRAAGKQEWLGFIRPLLDRSKMRDLDTGRPLSDRQLDELLDQTYERIRTDGLVDAEPSFVPRAGPKLANTRMESRFLTFRDADAWLAYQRRFGSPDLHATLLGHLDDMALDIARLEILGPNPKAMLSFMEQTVRRRVAVDELNETKANVSLAELRAVDDEQTGRSAIPLRPGVARGFQALRNVLTSAQLGAAAISAITDLNFQQMARGFNGLPSVTKGLVPTLRLMAPTEDQRFAVRMGLVAENWSSVALAQSRYFGETVGPNWSRLFADVVLRASLLSPWTQAGRWSFGLEFMGHLADNIGRGFGDMPAPTVRALERYGIDEAMWRRVTEAQTAQHGGSRFLDVPKLYETDPDVAARLHEMVLTETEFATPTVSDRVRAQLKGGVGRAARPGSFFGEALRSVAMYKSFPITIIHTHLNRVLRTAMPHDQRARYWAQIIIGTTVMGATAIQGKHIAKGRDPQDMTTPEFWGAAMAQGGGLGIFGDFLFSDVNRVGGTLTTTAAGPVFAFGDDLAKLTLGNVQQGLAGEETKVAPEAARFLERYTPGSSLWFARLAMERMVWDEMIRMADPEAARRFRREQRRALRERGQRFFWRPGQSLPDRAPDFGEAIGG